ncbi:MAG: zf-HC2 domain-containing protein [Bacillota bacterium]|nr:zf-HC2 domain-containing protein [Bacillota bacterium]
MNCRDVRALLSCYLDGEVDDTVRQSIEAHLAGCAPCKSEFEAISKTVRMIRRLQDLDPGKKPEPFAG